MKQITDLIIAGRSVLGRGNYVMLNARPSSGEALPKMRPGQFAQLRADTSKTTYLRRPISINDVSAERNEVSFLIQMIGDGTRALGELQIGDTLNAVLPLGNSFSITTGTPLLIGGGVGVAPLLFLGRTLNTEHNIRPTFLLGARTANDLLLLNEFERWGTVYTTTEDGSHGEKGFVTQHSALSSTQTFTHIQTCGPMPMMKAVATYAHQNDIDCEASLENTMACGIGACLCCVENTVGGHRCVCTDGPVFNTKELLWQN